MSCLSSPSPPGPHVASRCNCTICLKTGYAGMHLALPTTLHSAPLHRSTSCRTTSSTQKTYANIPAKTCGVQVYLSEEYKYEGTVVTFFAINIVTLDWPQKGLH